MQSDAEQPEDVPEEEQTDFVSTYLAKTLNSSLEAVHAQLALVAEAEEQRNEAMKLLRKTSRQGKKGKSPQRAGARDPNDWQPVFLAALRMIPNIRLACDGAGVSEKTAYKYRKTDPGFKEQWNECASAGADLLHACAWKKAVIGELEPIYQGGVRVGFKRVFSDRMLELLLKGHLPAMFRETHQVEMKVEGRVKAEHTTPQRVLDISRSLLPRLLEKSRKAS